LRATEISDDPNACREYLRSVLNLTAEEWGEIDLGGTVTVADELEIPKQFIQSVEMQQIRVWAAGFCYASVPKSSSVCQFVDLQYELVG